MSRMVDEGQSVPEEESQSLSVLLLTLVDHGSGPLSLDMILAHFGRRAFGAALFILAIPNLLPLPPGSSTVLGLPLLILAPQLAFGSEAPRIPRLLGRQTVDRAALDAVCRRAAPWVKRAEGLTRRRFGFMFGRLGDLAIGLVCTLLAAVLILPIPLGNLLPAAAVAALALSLVERDGVLTLLGYAIAGVSAGVLLLSGHVVLQLGHGARDGLDGQAEEVGDVLPTTWSSCRCRARTSPTSSA